MNKIREKEETLDIEYKYEKVLEYTNKSLNIEKERESNIYKVANSILTYISIMIVALTSIIFELKDRLNKTSYLIIIFGCILYSILFVSLFFVLKAHHFYKRKYLGSAKDYCDVINNEETFNKKTDFISQMISDYDEIRNSLTINNDKRTNNLFVSEILLYSMLALIVIFSIVIIIIEC